MVIEEGMADDIDFMMKTEDGVKKQTITADNGPAKNPSVVNYSVFKVLEGHVDKDNIKKYEQLSQGRT